jgi:hypothetical protein
MAARGQPKTGGRRKGTPNKLNADVKAMILAALAAKGGQKYLEKQADANPTAFLTLVGKLIPLQFTGKDCGPIQHQGSLMCAPPWVKVHLFRAQPAPRRSGRLPGSSDERGATRL